MQFALRSVSPRPCRRLSPAIAAAFANNGGPTITERICKMGVYFRAADNRRVAGSGAIGGWKLTRRSSTWSQGAPRTETPRCGRLRLRGYWRGGRGSCRFPGTTKLSRLDENIGATEVVLTPGDLQRIDQGALKYCGAGRTVRDQAIELGQQLRRPK